MYGQKSRHWIFSLLQPVTYLGVVMAAVVVVGTIYLVRKDRASDLDAAARHGANLPRCSKDASSAPSGARQRVALLRNMYEGDTANFDPRRGRRISTSKTI